MRTGNPFFTLLQPVLPSLSLLTLFDLVNTGFVSYSLILFRFFFFGPGVIITHVEGGRFYLPTVEISFV